MRGPRSLSAKLVASTVALFLVVTVAIGAVTALLTRDYLTRQMDDDLQGYAVRASEPDGRPDDNRIPAPPPDAGLLLLLRDGQIVRDGLGRLFNQVETVDHRTATLTDEQVTTLSTAGLGARPRTVDLGGQVGRYRVVAALHPSGVTIVAGTPTTGVDRTVRRLVLVIVGGTLVGLVLVTVGGTYLVRRSLEPLNRVAATARRVAGLKLDSGDVALAERVDAKDTDPGTEVGQVGLALNRMLDNVEGALTARQQSEMRVRRFVSDASHELRTPLASIRGYAELSRRETEPVPAGVSHAIGRVESEAERMTSLVEDLLLLARLDEGRPLGREEVDLTMLTINAVSDAHAASRDHAWQVDLPDEPVVVVGDEARLHQVLANLLANARVHTPPGTTVVTGIAPEGDLVRLSVTDDGPGVPAELQPAVFERFTRGDDARTRTNGSTGLGLSIVAAVGQAHGGRVEVESRPGRTRFSVLLPR